MIFNICSVPDILNIFRIIKLFITIIKIAVPTLLIISLMLKFSKVVSSGDANELEKVKKSAVSNIIAAVLIFLVPTFVNMIIKITPNFTGYENCIILATPEGIAQAHESVMEDLVVTAEKNPTEANLNIALQYLSKITDPAKKAEFKERLDKVEIKVEESKVLAIESVTVNDVVVNVKVSPGNQKVVGYYLSSIPKVPDRDGYDWIETNETDFKVTKYPGTYYVYVKDNTGKIIGGDQVVVPEIFDVTLMHKGKKSMPISIATYLERHNSTLDQLNIKMSSYNKKHVYRTRESVVVGAMAFTGEIQSWGYHLPYSGSNERLEKDAWGVYKYWGGAGKTFLACNPFVVWAFKQAGINIYGNRSKIKHEICNKTRINGQGQTEYEKPIDKPEGYGTSTVHIYYYFVGALASTKTYGDNIIERHKGRSGDILQSYPTSGHEMLIVDKYDDDMDGVSDGYIVLQSRDIGLCYEKIKYGSTVVYDMTAVYNNTANYREYLNGWNDYFILTSDYPSWMR